MTDRFKQHIPSSIGSSTHGFPITPSDTEDFPETVRGIYIGTAGTITLTLMENAELVFLNVAAGTILPVRAISIKATGTDATNLIGLV